VLLVTVEEPCLSYPGWSVRLGLCIITEIYAGQLITAHTTHRVTGISTAVRITNRRTSLFKAVLSMFTPKAILGLVAIFLHLCFSATLSWQDPRHPLKTPDPMVLLHGIEAARNNLRSGRLEYSVTISGREPSLSRGQHFSIRYVFDGDKRRLEQRQRVLMIDPPETETKQNKLVSLNYDYDAFIRLGLGSWDELSTRVVYDGTQMIDLHEDNTTSRVRFAKPAGAGLAQYGLLFDPRMFGLFVRGGTQETVASRLNYANAKGVKIVGRDTVFEHDAWHLVLDMPLVNPRDPNSTSEIHIWVDDIEGFPVYQIQDRIQGKVHTEYDCTYRDPIKNNVLPIRYRRRHDLDEHGRARVEMVFEEKQAEYSITVDPKEFTLAALNPRFGSRVFDERVRGMRGFWDGQQITKSLRSAKEQLRHTPFGVAANPWVQGRLWVWILLGSILVAGSICYWLWRSKASRVRL